MGPMPAAGGRVDSDRVAFRGRSPSEDLGHPGANCPAHGLLSLPCQIAGGRRGSPGGDSGGGGQRGSPGDDSSPAMMGRVSWDRLAVADLAAPQTALAVVVEAGAESVPWDRFGRLSAREARRASLGD